MKSDLMPVQALLSKKANGLQNWFFVMMQNEVREAGG